MKRSELAKHLFSVHELLKPSECAELIERGEQFGFHQAAVRTAFGPQLLPTIRDNDRSEFVDVDLASRLWTRCLPCVPSELEGGLALGLDEHFRFYRYDVGQRFKRHRDGVVRRSSTIRSRLTCLIYLNEDFTGGETSFFADQTLDGSRREVAQVTPRTGDALFFLHEWWHEGRALISGRKYVLRSDVFYRFPGEEDSDLMSHDSTPTR